MSAALETAKTSEGHYRPSALEFGFWAFLLIAVGRVNQLVPGLGSLPLAKLAILFPCLALLVKRQKLPPLSKNGWSILKSGLGMVALAVVLTPFSVWPGSSVHFLIYELPPTMIAIALAFTIRKSWESVRGTLLILLLCGFVLGGVATLHHSGGRAYDSSTDLDPNDLAYVLVTVMPLGIAFSILSKSRARKILYAATAAIITMAMLLTGSRGGMLGLLTVLVLLIFVPLGVTAPGAESRYARGLRASLAIALLVVCGGVLVWHQLPASMQDRYLTMLHMNQGYNADLNDKSGRESIWLQGLTAFYHRPVGYGPQTFQMVDVLFGGQFRAPHNSYLQVLVELGPLGLVFLLRMYFLAVRALQTARSTLVKRKSQTTDCVERAVLARALQFGLAANMVSGFFLSDAYAMLPWVISALSATIEAVPLEHGVKPQPQRERVAAEKNVYAVHKTRPGPRKPSVRPRRVPPK